YSERQPKSSTKTSESLSPIDIPKSHSTTVSEMSSPSPDSESLLSGWYSSPVAGKTSTALLSDSSTLPPDSSPQVKIPKSVSEKLYTALPPDSSLPLPDSSPQIRIPKLEAEDVEDNIENVVKGDMNNIDEVVSSYNRHKNGRELRKEQGEISLQFHEAS